MDKQLLRAYLVAVVQEIKQNHRQICLEHCKTIKLKTHNLKAFLGNRIKINLQDLEILKIPSQLANSEFKKKNQKIYLEAHRQHSQFLDLNQQLKLIKLHQVIKLPNHSTNLCLLLDKLINLKHQQI